MVVAVAGINLFLTKPAISAAANTPIPLGSLLTGKQANYCGPKEPWTDQTKAQQDQIASLGNLASSLTSKISDDVVAGKDIKDITKEQSQLDSYIAQQRVLINKYDDCKIVDYDSI